MVRAGLILLLLAGGASAQDRIAADAFLDLAEDRLLTFRDLYSRELIGQEEFIGRDRSVWRDAGGRCVFGKVSIANNKVCFLYEDDHDGLPGCWAVFQAGDRLFLRKTDALISRAQEVTDYSDRMLSCAQIPAI